MTYDFTMYFAEDESARISQWNEAQRKAEREVRKMESHIEQTPPPIPTVSFRKVKIGEVVKEVIISEARKFIKP